MGNDNPTDSENIGTAINFHITFWSGMSMARSMGTSMARTGKMSPKANVPKVKTEPLTILDGGVYSQSEINAANYMKSLGHNVVLRPPKGTRAAGGTSDLLINGINYDVYTPKTNKVSSIVSATAKKNSQTVGVVIDLSQTSVKPPELSNILQRVQGAGATNIKDIVIIP